jgi:transposase
MSHSTESVADFQSFVGVDLHKCTVTLVAVGPKGDEIAHLTISTKSVEKIEHWLQQLPRPCHLAVETCPFVEWFIERYRSVVDRIDIADATELANRRGKRRKNDRNDARDIALRLARGECPLGFIADVPLMQLRKRGRHWRQLSRLISRTKHAMKSLLHAANLHGPKFDGAGAQRWLLAHSHLLGGVQQQMFGDFVDTISLVERQREKLRRDILMAPRSEQFLETQLILQSTPGIGDIWSLIIAAEIGPFDRFPNSEALEFWAGLTPDLKESAGRTQSGNITKAGSATLRWALCQAALTLCKSDPDQEKIRQRLIRRIGKPKANVAMGRRLLRILYAMVRDKKPYARKKSSFNRAAAANAAKAERKAKGSSQREKLRRELMQITN